VHIRIYSPLLGIKYQARKIYYSHQQYDVNHKHTLYAVNVLAHHKHRRQVGQKYHADAQLHAQICAAVSGSADGVARNKNY
jgi:hypothetical protein